MSGANEAENRILAMKMRFIAYLEKHRIYELFYDLATQLMIKKPDNHLVFMKQYFELIGKKRDALKIILITPPNFDRHEFANVLQKELGVHPLTLKDLRKESSDFDNSCHCEESESVASAMKKILETGALHEHGWILVDFPRTKKEARALQRVGIIPTHVIQVILSNELENCKEIYTDDPQVPCSSKAPTKSSEERRCLKNLRELREAYVHHLIEVEVGIRSMEELGKDCAKLTKIRKHCGAPSLFRIALIGSRGSGCSTLAKYMSKRFNIVHLDYDYIAEQARLQEAPLGKKLRLFEYKWGERPKPEMRIQIVEKYVSDCECLKKGWVLTGYPKTVEDFKLLDMIPTPPNRVIFVEVNSDVCRERLLNRRYNIVTGSKHNIAEGNSKNRDCELGVHPKDYRMNVERDLQEYEENATEMIKYAGESAWKVDGNCDEKIVRERVEACLIRPAPYSKARVPKPPPEIDPANIEFNPDDEPDSSVFDDLRPPEPKYTFL